jgi:hypothetical protein
VATSLDLPLSRFFGVAQSVTAGLLSGEFSRVPAEPPRRYAAWIPVHPNDRVAFQSGSPLR